MKILININLNNNKLIQKIIVDIDKNYKHSNWMKIIKDQFQKLNLKVV